jgi:hypothetical protein
VVVATGNAFTLRIEQDRKLPVQRHIPGKPAPLHQLVMLRTRSFPFRFDPRVRTVTIMKGCVRMDIRRFMLDAALGLGLFSLALLAVAAGSAPAGAVGSTVASLETRLLPLGLIGAMFSLLLAFNLALYRHIRKAYTIKGFRRSRSGAADGS